MELSKFNPWNWFKQEESREISPVSRETARYEYPLLRLHQEIDRLFDIAFAGFSPHRLMEEKALQSTFLRPSVDVVSDDALYTIKVEAPGVPEDGITLELQNDSLIIRGEKRQDSEDDNKEFHRVERIYGKFERILSLPEDADSENIEARFKDGVLTITIPRKEASHAQRKVLEIKKAA